MKSLLVVLVFGSSLVFTFATQPSSDADKKEQAFKECNVTNPVQKDPRDVIATAIINEKNVNFSQEEKCHLNCFLQKVKFIDENGNMNGFGVFNYTLRNAPEIAPYSDVILAQIFRIMRSTKEIEDKCEKAFLTYYKFGEDIFTLALANGMSGTKDRIKNALDKGEPLPFDVQSSVESYLQFVGELTTLDPKSTFAAISQKVLLKIFTGVCLTCIQ